MVQGIKVCSTRVCPCPLPIPPPPPPPPHPRPWLHLILTHTFRVVVRWQKKELTTVLFFTLRNNELAKRTCSKTIGRRVALSQMCRAWNWLGCQCWMLYKRWDTGRWSPKNAMRDIFRILVCVCVCVFSCFRFRTLYRWISTKTWRRLQFKILFVCRRNVTRTNQFKNNNHSSSSNNDNNNNNKLDE